MAYLIFKYRPYVLIIIAALTVLLGYHAARLDVGTDFNRMVPQDHVYLRNYHPYKAVFGGGNQIKIALSRRHGTILDPIFLNDLRSLTEEIMFIKGVDRLRVRSLVSPETRYVVVNEVGFDMGPVVPNPIPESPEGLAAIAENITRAGLKGLLVSMDMQSALIQAEIYESGVDYLSVYRQLNALRARYTRNGMRVHISGFAMVVGFVNDAMPKILGLFGLSLLITLVVLYRNFGRLVLAMLPLISGGLSVLWSLGIIRLLGMRLDPMTTVVPFLVLAIGVSHGIQMVRRFLEACRTCLQGYEAALQALAGLIRPGTVALLTDAAGFLTILFVPIGVVRDLAVAASIGVACILVSNTVVLSLLLSFCRRTVKSGEDGECPPDRIPAPATRLLSGLARFGRGRGALKTAAVSVVLLLIGVFSSRAMTVGDVNPGEPLLWEDSLYNRDAARLMTDFVLGVDCLSVVVAGATDGICKRYDILRVMADFEEVIGKIPGVTAVVSPLTIARPVNEMLHEGDIRWRTLPQTPPELATVMTYAGSGDDSAFMNMGCRDMHIRIFLSDHQGATLRRVIERIERFVETHPLSDAKFILAGGNAGVMAAANDEVARAEKPMLFLIYLTICVLCLVMFRSLKAPFFIIAPLLTVSFLATGFMKAVGLGLNVNTLPVASLGVGIGVDYGIYIYARLQEERRRQTSFAAALEITLHTTGSAVLYTALTLSAGVLIWLFSDLKFQADMGLLLGFIFLANMFAALVLLPALVFLFDTRADNP